MNESLSKPESCLALVALARRMNSCQYKRSTTLLRDLDIAMLYVPPALLCAFDELLASREKASLEDSPTTVESCP